MGLDLVRRATSNVWERPPLIHTASARDTAGLRQSVMMPVIVRLWVVKPVRTPVAILGSLGVCIYVPASRHWLISYSPIHLI